jgi:hypothetical protein
MTSGEWKTGRHRQEEATPQMVIIYKVYKVQGYSQGRGRWVVKETTAKKRRPGGHPFFREIKPTIQGTWS